MQKSYLNKLICICMALMFAIAVIGSSNGIESSSRKLPVSARQNAFCERNADDGTAQGLRPVSMCEDMDGTLDVRRRLFGFILPNGGFRFFGWRYLSIALTVKKEPVLRTP